MMASPFSLMEGDGAGDVVDIHDENNNSSKKTNVVLVSPEDDFILRATSTEIQSLLWNTNSKEIILPKVMSLINKKRYVSYIQYFLVFVIFFMIMGFAGNIEEGGGGNENDNSDDDPLWFKLLIIVVLLQSIACVIYVLFNFNKYFFIFFMIIMFFARNIVEAVNGGPLWFKLLIVVLLVIIILLNCCTSWIDYQLKGHFLDGMSNELERYNNDEDDEEDEQQAQHSRIHVIPDDKKWISRQTNNEILSLKWSNNGVGDINTVSTLLKQRTFGINCVGISILFYLVVYIIFVFTSGDNDNNEEEDNYDENNKSSIMDFWWYAFTFSVIAMNLFFVFIYFGVKIKNQYLQDLFEKRFLL